MYVLPFNITAENNLCFAYETLKIGLLNCSFHAHIFYKILFSDSRGAAVELKICDATESINSKNLNLISIKVGQILNLNVTDSLCCIHVTTFL